MTPLPTPYDITDIPYFPYVPGLLVWSVFILTVAAIFFLLKYVQGSRKKNKLKAFDLAKKELHSLYSRSLQDGVSKEAAAIAALVAKRYISASELIDLAPMTAKELEEFGRQCGNRCLEAMLAKIIELEGFKYQQNTAGSPGCDLLKHLCEDLDRFQKHREAKGKDLP